MPSADKFNPATPENSGIVQAHIHAIHRVCKREDAFVFVRPSTAATMRLIKAGFSTKSMDVHDKSSDWGLTSGLVPVDQAFSKNRTGVPNPAIHPHGHGAAQPVALTFTPGQFAELLGNRHFEHTDEVQSGQTPCAPRGESQLRHFHSSKNPEVCFLWPKAGGPATWRWRNKGPMANVPLWVWGYNGVPVTGDYDLWMVAPHVSNVRWDNSVQSVKDVHGRSAATRFTTELMTAMNEECGRLDKPVFNHGAEAQNFSFTQSLDKHLAVFTPSVMEPFVITRAVLPGILHDLLRHGYVVVRNPKWISGSTLGIEDMAEAAELFPDDKTVQAGVRALAGVRASAARAIQRNLRRKRAEGAMDYFVESGDLTRSDADAHLTVFPQKDEGWSKRMAELKPMRALGNMPDDQGADLVLPEEAFPAPTYVKQQAGNNRFAVLATMSEGAESAEARALARSQEQRFGRTGFVQEDGGVVPRDATRRR